MEHKESCIAAMMMSHQESHVGAGGHAWLAKLASPITLTSCESHGLICLAMSVAAMRMAAAF